MVSALTPGQWVLCLTAVLLSGVLRGFSGFGFALAATPLLGSIMPPAKAVPIVLLLQIGTSFVSARATLAEAEYRSALPIGLGAMVAAPLGSWMLAWVSDGAARMLAASLTLFSVAVLAAGIRFLRRPGIVMSLGSGLAAGLFGGLCAMPGPPVILYYLASPVEPAQARASMILIFLATSLAACAGAAAAGLVSITTMVIVLASAPMMVAGTWVGGQLFLRHSGSHYRRASMAALVLVAIIAFWRAFH
ncbi:MAG TPA: sulfite exporter TauE/SafE family protein [Sphingobium sp.]|nr:sulfite exporter TauE/SafE family protein [Sphingobium sp.]